MLDYQAHGIPIKCINTHLLWSGCHNALSLASYSQIQILKLGHWQGKILKEYIFDGINLLSKGMSWDMQWTLSFINVTGGMWSDVSDVLVYMDYNPNEAQPNWWQIHTMELVLTF